MGAESDDLAVEQLTVEAQVSANSSSEVTLGRPGSNTVNRSWTERNRAANPAVDVAYSNRPLAPPTALAWVAHRETAR